MLATTATPIEGKVYNFTGKYYQDRFLVTEVHEQRVTCWSEEGNQEMTFSLQAWGTATGNAELQIEC